MPRTQEPATRLVVVGASAGGVPALRQLVSELASDLGAAVLVVLHLSPNARSMLPQILGRVSALPVARPRDSEPIVTGRIYAAPPDHHLLVDGSVLRVTHGPWDNAHRPSIDALFRSAATWYADRTIGVVLTGALDDGSIGLAAIVEAGGTALIQDPAEAEIPGMPENALALVPAATPLGLDALAKELNRLCPPAIPSAMHPSAGHVIDERTRLEAELARGRRVAPEQYGGTPAALTCPDCNGSLFVVPDSKTVRFRCRVGHGWTAEALMSSHGRSLEQALWAALRVLEDNQALEDRMAIRASERRRTFAMRDLARRKEERHRLIAILHRAIEEFDDLSHPLQVEDSADQKVVAQPG